MIDQLERWAVAMNIEELEQIAETALREHDKYDYEVNVCMAHGLHVANTPTR